MAGSEIRARWSILRLQRQFVICEMLLMPKSLKPFTFFNSSLPPLEPSPNSLPSESFITLHLSNHKPSTLAIPISNCSYPTPIDQSQLLQLPPFSRPEMKPAL